MTQQQQTRALRSVASGQADVAQYRAALAQLAQERERAHADANRAMQDIANLLPRAIQTGISVVDVAQLTGLSRPTLYRMLSESRERRPLREIAVQFEQALEQNNQALPADLANRFGTSIEQVFEALMGLYPLVADELAALGQPALTSLVEFLPELGVPERIVLAMRFLQGQTTDYVAASTQLPGNEVPGWAALGLLRVLPRIRAAQEGAAKHSSTAVSVDRRYRVGDPRRHRRFDL
jgi:DNA-binding phage protein